MKITPQIICDIIAKGMSLSSEQIWVYNQRRSIPEDKRLYVTVGQVNQRVYSNDKKQIDVGGALKDQICVRTIETISINLFSYDTESVERAFEVLASLNSTYSQQVQEALAIKIAEVPLSVSDVSEIEGPAILFRMNITLNVWRKYDKILDSQYYDQFEYDSILSEQ
jgi:hypothetical protein